MKYIILLSNIYILVLFYFSSTFAQEFSVKNFSPESFDSQPQNWEIIQDNRGIIYIANNGGLYEYDGINFSFIRIPNFVVRSLAVDKDNVLYLGGINEIGFLTFDSSYSPIFKTLSDKISKDKSILGSVYQTLISDDKVFFCTAKFVFEFQNNTFKVWNAENKFSRAFILNNEFYIRDKGIGLKKLSRQGLLLINNYELFTNLSPVSTFNFNNKNLVVTYQNGLYNFDEESYSKLNLKDESVFKSANCYNAALLNENKIAVATLSEGIFLLDENYSITKQINKSLGLIDNNVKYVYNDRQNNLWAGLNLGISKISINNPFTFFDFEIEGLILSLEKYGDNLLLGTTNKLYLLKNRKSASSALSLITIQTPNTSIWDVKVINGSVLIATNNGLFSLNKSLNTIKNIFPNRTFFIHQSKRFQNIILVGTNDGISILNSSLTQNPIKEIIQGIEVKSIAEDREGNIWAGTNSNGVLKISSLDPEQTTHYKENELNLPFGEIIVFAVNGRIVFSTQKGLCKFNKTKMMFEADTVFGKTFADGSQRVFRLSEDKDKNVWIHSNSKNYFAKFISDENYRIISKPFNILPRDQVNSILPDRNFTWFGTHYGLIRFDSRVYKNYDLEFNTLIRKIYVNTDSLIYGGASLLKDYKPINLKFENRNLRFQYAATFYEAEERTEYQYKLDGYDDKWSNWTKETQKDYTNLSEGDYTFNVRGKNVYGTIGNIGSYSFKVLPPFYRTIWAYLFYAVLVLSFGYIIVKWRINKLEKDKINLENLVDEKTKEVKEQAEKLKELDKIKSRFFANISHEFRTPLTLILGPVEQLLIEDKSKERSKTYSMIHRNSRRLLMLINQLLDLSKLESGNMNLNLSKINIVKLVREVSSLFESIAAKKNIGLTFSSSENNIQIYCDLDKIEKVFINLFSNAFKFTSEGKISSSIELHEENVIIKITDTGIGIDEDKLEKVFEHFYQADNSTKRSFEGSGIGLSLVKEFIELHKGKISANSSPNRGTEFIISLPANIKDLLTDSSNNNFIIEDESLEIINNELIDEEAVDNSVAEITQKEPAVQDKNSILIVEDNIDVREYLKEHLQDDFEITEAENGKDGIDAAVKIIPDLIISDVMMPVMDGYEFCKKVKTNLLTSHIPVILLTAKAGDSSVLEGLEYGANDYVTKPFNINILHSRINNLIALRRNLQDKIKSDLLLKPSEIKVSSFDEDFLTNLHNLIEERIDDPELSIEELADKLFINRISLYRKIKALTGDSPSVFLRSYRLKRAVQLLEQKKGNVTEIAFQVGFTNSAYFTKCFREQFGRLPSDYLAN